MSEEPQEMHVRVNRLEWRVDGHDLQLSQLHQDNQQLQGSLESINKRLSAIFWAIVGAAFLAVANEFGLLAIIKGML